MTRSCFRFFFVWIKKHFCVTLMTAVFLTKHWGIATAFGPSGSYPSVEYFKPLRYDLNILTDLSNKAPNFRGCIIITIECLKSTSQIVLNAKNIIEGSVSVNLEEKLIDILGQTYGTNDDQYIIILKQPLEFGKIYKLKLQFSQNFLNDISGYGFHIYQRASDGKLKWLTITNIAKDGARTVFPCFDHPNMKAEFKVTHVHPDIFVGVSNGKLKSTKFYSPGYVVDEFDVTAPMAPFSLIIALFSFKSETVVEPASKCEIQVLADRTIIHNTNHLFEAASRIIKFYSNFYNVPYSLDKLDIIVFPNSSVPVSESYGVITVSESLVLSSKKDITIFSNAEYTLFSSMCLVISKQWIGNFVTMNEKAETWLHTGLNRLFQAECVQTVLPKWESSYADLAVLESYLYFLETEEKQSSWPGNIINNPYFIGKFDENEVNKAYHLVRMMDFIMGSEVLKEAVRIYLGEKSFQFANSTLHDTLKIFTRTTDSHSEELLPKHLGLKNVMESWVYRPGIPLLRATRDYKSGSVILQQEVFRPFKEIRWRKYRRPCWMIPLIYTTRAERDLENVQTKRKWLLDFRPLEIDIDVGKNDWILFNFNTDVIVRVTYDRHNWKLIQKDFLNQFDRFDLVTRTKLISDMFALAEAKILSYGIVFDTMKYLKKETHLTPLQFALRQFSIIRLRLLGSPLLKPFEKYVKTILEPLYEINEHEDDMFSNKIYPKKDYSKSRLREALMKSACEFGIDTCKERGWEYLHEWNDDFLIAKWILLPSSIQDEFLCQGIKYEDEDRWDILQSLYVEKKESEMKLRILKALSCSTKSKMLKKYLKWSLEKETISPRDSIIMFGYLSSNEKGYPLMKRFFIRQYEEIFSFHSQNERAMVSYMTILLDATTLRKDYDHLLKFGYIKKINMLDEFVQESVTNALRNVIWFERSGKSLRNYFNIGFFKWNLQKISN